MITLVKSISNEKPISEVRIAANADIWSFVQSGAPFAEVTLPFAKPAWCYAATYRNAAAKCKQVKVAVRKPHLYLINTAVPVPSSPLPTTIVSE